MAESNGNGLLWIIVLIVVAALVLGLVGSSEASKIGTTCDLGIGKDSLTEETGSALCWKWHRNEIGQIGDNLKDIFGDK